MAEVPKTASVPSSTSGKRTGSGFELRLERGAAHVRLAGAPITDGLELDVLDLLVPDVRFPFDVGAGSGQFRHRLSDLDELAVSLEPTLAERTLTAAGPEALGLLDLRLAFRDPAAPGSGHAGFAELSGRLTGGTRFTLCAGLVATGDRGVAIVLHAPRLYGPAPLPEGALVHAVRRLVAALGEDVLPEDPVSRLLRRVLAPRGWKIPRTAGIRLARAEVAGGAVRLAWSRAAVPAALSSDPELLAAEEGERTFAAAEALLSRGDHEAAREAYLAAPGANGHPFAAERLLGLLALDERFHDEALDLAHAWLSRRPGFPASLTAEAAVRIARGEEARAARALADLAEGAAQRGEASSALAAAETAFGLAGAASADARRAAEVALAVRRDHVPALRALRDLALAAGDREALVRASRRLVAYDPDGAQKARAHAQLGELLLATDPAAARLHLDQALRHAPDDPDALASLARACEAAGEPLRAVRALDRLRELFGARGEPVAAAKAAFEAGVLWDEQLAHAENALLRFREAAELAPSAEAHERAALAATRAGQWAEAADHHGAVLSLLSRGAGAPPERAVRTRVALAAIAEERLADLPAAAAHLEAAAALAPERADLWRRLAGLDRTLGRTAALAAALDRLAALTPDLAERAAALAQSGEAALALGLPAEARGRFVAALAADERSRVALDGLARLAAQRGDAAAERDALSRLVPLAAPGEEAAALQDRLAEACERVGDLGGAHRALAAARAAAPTPARLEAAIRLARRSADAPALATLLSERAVAAAARGDAPLAASSWLERARLLAPDEPGQALAALAEARAAAPGDPEVLRAQAAFGEAHADPRLALGALRGLLAQEPADAADLEVRAGRAALGAGEPAAAREHAERALSRNAPGAGDLLADILDRTGDDAGRADLLERIGRPLEAARLHERRGDRPRACAALERAAADPAAAAEALERLADLRLADGDRRGAATALLALAARTPGRGGARLALRAFESGGDAAAALDLGAERDPSFAPVRARRAVLRADADPAGALADAEAALAGDELPVSERGALLALAARAAEGAGDAIRAAAHLTALAAASPADPAVLRRLAALQRRVGPPDALRATLERLLPVAGPGEGVPVRLELSDLLLGAEPARATALAEEALALDPASTRALAALAWPPRSGDASPAVRSERLARLAARPDVDPAEAARAHAARARLLADLGDAAGALEAARAAAAGGAEDEASLALRAELARRAGDVAEEARAALALGALARGRGEPLAAERLAEAGLLARAAGVDGAEPALREALALGVERETARTVLEALVELARARGDVGSEREALAAVVPHLPTGARPAALVRLSGLALAAGAIEEARSAADEARTLAPRDPAAVECARAAAEASGDPAAVADRLAELAALEPAAAGARLLERARLLAGLRRAEEADAAFLEALAALPPDRALADAHTALRRGAGLAEAGAPLEAFARRAPSAREAARALRAASAVALEAGDWGAALRCARRAVARTQDDLAFAGPLLARILWLRGSAAEALVLHRRLLDLPEGALAAEERLTVLRQAAELAEEAGDRELAAAALDRLLALRPHDLASAWRRFAVDPDRRKAIEGLAAAAERTRGVRAKVAALQRAGEAALIELEDRTLADRLLRRARAEAEVDVELSARIARERAAVVRAALGVGSDAFLDALEEAAAAVQATGDRAGARALYAETATLLRERGQLADAARLLLQLDALAAADGDFDGSAAYAREAGLALRDAGLHAQAQEVLRRVVAANPADAEAFAALGELLERRGDEGQAALAELIQVAAASAAPGAPRAALLVRLAGLHGRAGDLAAQEAALRNARTEVPGHPEASAALAGLYAAQGRVADQAALLLDRAEAEPLERSALRREAATLLSRSPDAGDRRRGLEVLVDTARRAPSDLSASREAAQALVAAGRREEAAPFLSAIVLADPDDEAAAALLAEAWASRPLERARVFLDRAEAAKGEVRALRLAGAANAFAEAGEEGRARETRLLAFEAWPTDGAAFAAALREAAGDPERLDRVLSARAGAVPGEAAACHRARADALAAVGALDRAAAAYEAALAATPDDPALLASLAATLAAAHGDGAASDADRRLVGRAEAAPGAVPAAAEASARFRLGIAAWAGGRPGDAIRDLERALHLAPSDPRAGSAWTALADGHAALGDGAAALAAARGRADRAVALGLAPERRLALEAGAALAARFGDAGADAAELLDALLAVRVQAGDPPGEIAELARRAAAALDASGEPVRARVALARAGLTPSGPLAVAAQAAPTSFPESSPAAAVPESSLEARPAGVPESSGAAAGFPESSRPQAGFPESSRLVAAAPEGEPQVEASERARAAAERALAATDPGERAATFVEYAGELRNAGAPADEQRAALELAADADPDAPDPWRARARLEAELGDPDAAARANLAVAIRAEGDEATSAALEAARLFGEAGHHPEAARALRAAHHAAPEAVPVALAESEEALGAGDLAAAAEKLLETPLDRLPASFRGHLLRRLARALDEAGRKSSADAVYADLFREDPADAVAFTRAADHAFEVGGADAWLAAAGTHEAALGSWGDSERRRDLRYARGEVLAAAGRLEASRAAYLAALELDPEHVPTRYSLDALDARAEDWAALAAEVAREAGAAADPAEAASLHLRVGNILRDRLGDAAGAILSLRSAVEASRESPAPAARRTQAEAEAALSALGAPMKSPHQGEPAALPAPAPPSGDPVAEVLRAQAEGATGLARAELLERLAGHLERAGDRGGAADALFLALEADPERELTHAWLAGLVEGDSERTTRARALRPAPVLPEGREERSTGDFTRPERTTGDFPPSARAERSTGDFPPPERAERTTGDFPPSERPERPTLDEYATPERPTLDEFPLPEPAAVPPPEELPPLDLGDGAPEGADAASSAEPPAPADTAITGSFPPLTPAPGSLTVPPEIEALPRGPLTPFPVPPPTPPPQRLGRITSTFEPGEPPARTTGVFPPPESPERSTGPWPPPAAIGRARTDTAWPAAPEEETVPPAPPRASPRIERRVPESSAPGVPESSAPPRTRTDSAFPPAPRPPTDPRLPASPPPLDHPPRSTGQWPPPLPAGAAAPPPSRPPAQLAAAGRVELQAGRLDDARALLEEAFLREPTDLTLARDLQKVAERQGRHEDYLQLGEVLADALASYDPLAAAARFRHFAEVARQRLGRDDRAAAFLEKALSLVPDDAAARRELLELWASRPDTAPRALAAWLDVARAEPSDGQALAAVVSLCAGLAATATRLEAVRMQERGRIAAALGAVVAPGRVPPPPAVPAVRALPAGLRDKVALPGAGGPLAKLVALLSPWLETLFPADLARRGATPADRLVPPRGAGLRTALDSAVISLGARPYAAFLTARQGIEIAIENTQPPSIVAAAGVEALPEPALAFHAARSMDLLTHGWALLGKFAPRDVGILLELACRFAGGAPPSLGLPAQRAGAFLKALEGAVPPATRSSAQGLAAAASAELARTDPRAFCGALRRTASRIALVHAGDPGAALSVLAELERRAPAEPPPRPLEPPDARDLAGFALSDAFLDLRVSVRS